MSALIHSTSWANVWKYVRIPLILLMAGAFFYFVPLEEVFAALVQTNPWYFLMAVLVTYPALYLMSLRLWILTRKLEIRLTSLELFRINLGIRFYSIFSPASVLGSGLRWYRLSAGQKHAEALSAVSFSRLLDVLFSVVIGLFWVLTSVYGPGVNAAVTAGLLGILAAVILLVTRYSRPIGRQIERLASRQTRPIAKKALGFGQRVFQSMALYSDLTIADWSLIVLLTILAELVSLASLLLLAIGLAIPISLTDLGWMRSIFYLASFAPFTLAGGFGLREVSVVVIISAFGASKELATAFSLVMYARSALVGLLAGALELGEAIEAWRK
jgi:uncharacterized protein (TIRG00374 family)